MSEFRAKMSEAEKKKVQKWEYEVEGEIEMSGEWPLITVSVVDIHFTMITVDDGQRMVEVEKPTVLVLSSNGGTQNYADIFPKVVGISSIDRISAHFEKGLTQFAVEAMTKQDPPA